MSHHLFLLPSDLIGGAENVLRRLAKHFLDKGDAVDVIFLSRKNRENDNTWLDLSGANLIYVNAHKELVGAMKMLASRVFQADRWRKRYNYAFSSHVHCNAFLSLMKRSGLLTADHLVMRESSNMFEYIKDRRQLLMRVLYKFYDSKALLVCQTSKMKEDLIHHVPYFRERHVCVIPNPVDVTEIEKLSLERCPVSISDYASDSKLIVSVGRLVKEKAFDTLLSAFSRLGNDVVLMIVGEGYLRRSLEGLAAELGISDRVIFVGHLKNPFPVMRKAHVGVVSSRLEGFPNTLLEKMILCRSIVSTECADGISEIDGILSCPVDDILALRDSLLGSLHMSDDKTAEMKHQCLEEIASRTCHQFMERVDYHYPK